MLPRLPVETRSRRVIFEAMPICEGCGQEGRATDRDFEWMGSQEDQYFRDPHTALRLYCFPTGCRPRDPALYPPPARIRASALNGARNNGNTASHISHSLRSLLSAF